ncbi:hypothetical protein PSBY109024_03010 [Pseudoalteromonas byunsanensis]
MPFILLFQTKPISHAHPLTYYDCLYAGKIEKKQFTF